MNPQTIKEKLAARQAQNGYPLFVWWIPLVMYSCTTIALVVGVAQRADSGHVLAATGLAVLSAVPWFFDGFALRLRWWVSAPLAATPALVLVTAYPVEYDFAIFSLVMLVGHLGALERFWESLTATALVIVAIGTLGVTGQIEASAFWIAAILVGWDIGFIMQYQQRQLDEQQENARSQQVQAVLEERQRIAREVHDVIAHSLSVTLLHVTAARRTLADDELSPADLADAEEALIDAERVGRQAMAEIRQTVGLLGQPDHALRPAPDLRDLDQLVTDFRTAGLDVELDISGDPSAVPAQVGLGLYRIAQESLANIAKHESSARAVVVLEADARRQAMQIWNTVGQGAGSGPSAGGSAGAGGGSGIPGMRQRAQLLDAAFMAGPRDGVWVVEVQVPRADAKVCKLGLNRLHRLLPLPPGTAQATGAVAPAGGEA